MIKRYTLALGVALLANTVRAESAKPAKPIEVMVLGAYHMGNPSLDTNNAKVDSVLTPQRQAELASLANALLTFHPNKVMVEQQVKGNDLSLASYRAFTPAKLKTEANEVTQIGFRVAKQAGLSDVQGIDEQPEGNEPDYFPYDKLQEGATKFGYVPRLNALIAESKTGIGKFEAAQKTSSVAQLLTFVNKTDYVRGDTRFYYGVLDFGDNDSQAGADLNAMWYLRNAKIFAKLMHNAKPGDRILVVYGAGHNFWLRHFASNTPGYRFVDPLPYLKKVGTKAVAKP